MIKRIIPIALIGATIFSLNACKSGGGEFKKTEGGLEYKIVKDEPGDKHAAIGDIVEMHIKMKADDSLLADSRAENMGKPVQIQLQTSPIKSDWTNGIALLTEGDSAIFRMSIDTLRSVLKGQPLPPFMEKRKFLTYEVKLVSIKSQKQMQEDQEKHAAAQNGIDDKLLQEYFTKNNLKPTKTNSGLYYIIEKEGAGESPKPGQEVTVNYTGRTMDGNMFDSNTDPSKGHVEPFTFMLGQHQVIDGWDEGVALMKKGTKAKLFIPSSLAYGQAGRQPSIPGDAILIFDIEVLKFADAQPQMQGQPQVQ